MGTELITSMAGDLDAELERARETLKDVDDNIKKLFGKDAVEINQFGVGRRLPPQVGRDRDRDRGRDEDRRRRRNSYNNNDDEPIEKRRRSDRDSRDHRDNSTRYGAGGGGGGSSSDPRLAFISRDGGRNNQFSRGFGEPMRLQSRVVNSAKEKSRDEVLAEQRRDSNGRDRNKRMFGALLGTLQRFKQDESKLKEKEEKRAQIEAKLDETLTKEMEEVKKERMQLIKDRRIKQTDIKRLEFKRRRIAELGEWEEKTKYLANFIKTDSKPSIFYLPKKLNPITECKLEQSKQFVAELISSQRKLVFDDLEDYEKRSRRNLERQQEVEDSGKNNDGHGKGDSAEDSEEELIEIIQKEYIEDDDGDVVMTEAHDDDDENNDEKENGERDSSSKREMANIRIKVENNTLKAKDNRQDQDQEDGQIQSQETGSEPDDEERNSASDDEETEPQNENEPGPPGDD